MKQLGKIALALVAALVASTTWARNYTLTLKPVKSSYGNVVGGGKYAADTKVTIKAKAKSGYVFAGWYTDKACKTKLNPKGYDNRKPAVKIKMPSKNTTIYARFVTKAEDKKTLRLTSATKKLAKTAANATVGTKITLKLGIYSYSLMTVTAKGLPEGLKVDQTSGVISGKPKSAGLFKATVTVKTAAGNSIKFKVKIVVRDGVQLWENGPYWATTNIGADNPWDYGLYFWWGDTKGYSPSSDGKFSFNFDGRSEDVIYTYWKYPSELRKAGWLKNDILTPEHDAAHVQWGEQWRMPTVKELEDLKDSKYCDWKWTAVNGVYGCLVSGKGDYASASIFLPAAGAGYENSLYFAGTEGCYWTSEVLPYPMDLEQNLSYRFIFKKPKSKKPVDSRAEDEGRETGLTIRPVKVK